MQNRTGPVEEQPQSDVTTSRRNFLTQSAAATAGFALGAKTAPAEIINPVSGAAPALVSPFLLGSTRGTLTSLRFAGDAGGTENIEPGLRLGDLVLAWRTAGGSWQRFASAKMKTGQREPISLSHHGTGARDRLVDGSCAAAMEVETRLATDGPLLRWSIHLRNISHSTLEIGDLALPLPLHTLFKEGQPATASVLKHSFISGAGSFLFWMRSNSIGPYLLMLPEQGTALEFWERIPAKDGQPSVYTAYLHSKLRGAEIADAGGRWRQPHTFVLLKPGEVRSYAFVLQAAEDYDAIRRLIAAAGLLDMEVAPGMTVPTDLSTTIAFRSSNSVTTVTAEHPGQTSVGPLGLRGEYQCFRVHFGRLGENLLTVRQSDGRETRFEFFATEPLETLIQKRGAFIANHQQRETDKWYRGLLSEWNMENEVMLGPDNYDRITGWRQYEVTCDDPGLSKPAFLASKQAEFPVQSEIDALDDYIEHFVWGGLQQTTKESYPYGIYGIIDWKSNRESTKTGTDGRLHMWRPYDYPHIAVMYWGMYRTARDFPAMHTRFPCELYLERAYGTALAMFTLPRKLTGWEAYETGFYNEMIIPALIDELERVGHADEAKTLRTEWEKKVSYFVAGSPNLFGSEYAFDSTGFESIQALARYAIDRTAPGPIKLPVPVSAEHIGASAFAPISAKQAKAFATKQMRANLFCRGMLEKAYYTYGSDLRSEGDDSYLLSYMAQMGGWGVLDHALQDRLVKDATVRLGYASFLSAWALMNTGTADTDYGYWFPGAKNDGGVGGGFEPAAMSHTWLGMPNHRGAWFYSCEEDLGFCAALRTACSVLTDDPIFGPFYFGGVMTQAGSVYRMEPRDGLRRRISIRLHRQSLDVELTGARLSSEAPAEWDPVAGLLRLPLERAAGAQASLLVHGLTQFRAQLAELELTGRSGKAISLPGPGAELLIRYSADAAKPDNG